MIFFSNSFITFDVCLGSLSRWNTQKTLPSDNFIFFLEVFLDNPPSALLLLIIIYFLSTRSTLTWQNSQTAF